MRKRRRSRKRSTRSRRWADASMRARWPWAAAVAALGLTGCVVAWAQETTSSVVEGVYSDEQAARGAKLFQQSCALCHGAALGGLGEAPALIGAQFIVDFHGLTVGE